MNRYLLICIALLTFVRSAMLAAQETDSAQETETEIPTETAEVSASDVQTPPEKPEKPMVRPELWHRFASGLYAGFSSVPLDAENYGDGILGLYYLFPLYKDNYFMLRYGMNFNLTHFGFAYQGDFEYAAVALENRLYFDFIQRISGQSAANIYSPYLYGEFRYCYDKNSSATHQFSGRYGAGFIYEPQLNSKRTFYYDGGIGAVQKDMNVDFEVSFAVGTRFYR